MHASDCPTTPDPTTNPKREEPGEPLPIDDPGQPPPVEKPPAREPEQGNAFTTA